MDIQLYNWVQSDLSPLWILYYNWNAMIAQRLPVSLTSISKLWPLHFEVIQDVIGPTLFSAPISVATAAIIPRKILTFTVIFFYSFLVICLVYHPLTLDCCLAQYLNILITAPICFKCRFSYIYKLFIKARLEAKRASKQDHNYHSFVIIVIISLDTWTHFTNIILYCHK